MVMSGILASCLAGVAPALLAGGGPRTPVRADAAGARDDRGWMLRYRTVLSLLAGAGALVVVGGRPGEVAGSLAAVVCWRAIGRAEPASVRREREELRRELPQLARLLAAALAAGAAPATAAEAVADALPGPGGTRLGLAAARLRLGADPVAVWRELADEPALGPLGRALVRGHSSGSSIVASVERLGDELAHRVRADVEDRARRVGVKAAVPLGVCLLPSFLMIGIVPLVGGLLRSLQL